MGRYGLTDEVIELREQMRAFIDGEVIPAEPDLEAEQDRARGRMAELKALAKQRGLWALGHPAEIGGGGLPLMSFVYLNEIIGRSHYGQIAVGSASMQDSIMLHLYGSGRAEEALARAPRGRRHLSLRRPDRARGRRLRPHADAEPAR